MWYLIKNGKVGGITGENYGTIEYCTNKLDVSGIQISAKDIFTGGIVGINRKNIEFCKNEGNIAGTGNREQTQTGGIAGFNNKDIKSCYNKGNVTGIGGETTSSQVYSGGIAGINWTGDEITLNIERCYNEGNIHGENGYYTHVGGMIGEVTSNSNIKQCCNVSYVTGKGIDGGTLTYLGGICGLVRNITIENSYYYNQYIDRGIGYGTYEEDELIGIDNINDIPSVKEITGYDF